jgi:1,4-dihydroxy-2-naphthoyl-CoA hydrolase
MPPDATAADDLAATLNDNLDGWNAAMGIRFVRATRDEVVAELHVGAVHRQPYGVVHGGVYAGMIETIASVGAALDAIARGQSVVGLENNTSFLRATREGTLRATARPLARGRRSQVWQGEIVDDAGRIVAAGRVRLLALDPDASLAGETVEVKAETVAGTGRPTGG